MAQGNGESWRWKEWDEGMQVSYSLTTLSVCLWWTATASLIHLKTVKGCRVMSTDFPVCLPKEQIFVPTSACFASHRRILNTFYIGPIKASWPESASEIYRLSDRRLSEKLVPTFADRGCHVVTVTDRPYYQLSRPEPLLFFQVASQLYSQGWGNPVQDLLLLRKSDSAGIRTRTSGSVASNSDH
jgi:hypothetical protein